MKHAGILILTFFVFGSFTFGVTLTRTPSKILETDGPVPYPVEKGIIQLPSKTDGEQVFSGVHDYSAYIASVRPIAMDPAFGATFMFLRGSTGSMGLYYVGTVDGGASWSTQGPLTGSIRYPSAMADLNNNKPVAFYNWGFGSLGEGAYSIWDDGNYNDGLWSAEKNIDSLGRGVAETAIYCVSGAMGASGEYNAVANYWETYPDASFGYHSATYGNSWGLSDPRCLDNLRLYVDKGTPDSLNIFKTNPVVHAPLHSGYIQQNAITASPDGQTVAIYSIGQTPDSVTGTMKAFYWKSTDGGATWGDLQFMPLFPDSMLGWNSEIYEIGGAIDNEGYLHLATHFFMDTKSPTDSSDYGPLTGIYDQYETATGYEYSFVTGAVDSASGVSLKPGFCNFALTADGDLILSFCSDGSSLADPADIYVTRSNDNGRKWGVPKKLTDGTQACWYPHIPMFIGGYYTVFPVFYQVGNDAYIRWIYYYEPGVNSDLYSSQVYQFAITKKFPNPVKGYANFSFTLPKESQYSLKVYNIAGQLVKNINGDGQKGPNNIKCNIDGLANGVYLYNLTANGKSATGKMVVLK